MTSYTAAMIASTDATSAGFAATGAGAGASWAEPAVGFVAISPNDKRAAGTDGAMRIAVLIVREMSGKRRKGLADIPYGGTGLKIRSPHYQSRRPGRLDSRLRGQSLCLNQFGACTVGPPWFRF